MLCIKNIILNDNYLFRMCRVPKFVISGIYFESQLSCIGLLIHKYVEYNANHNSYELDTTEDNGQIQSFRNDTNNCTFRPMILTCSIPMKGYGTYIRTEVRDMLKYHAEEILLLFYMCVE